MQSATVQSQSVYPVELALKYRNDLKTHNKDCKVSQWRVKDCSWGVLQIRQNKSTWRMRRHSVIPRYAYALRGKKNRATVCSE